MADVGEIVESRRLSYMYEWKFQCDITMTSRELSYYWNSPKFNCSNGKWYLHIRSEDSEWLSLHLMRVDCDCKLALPVFFTLGMKAKDGTPHKFKNASQCFAKWNNEYRWPRLVKRDELMQQKRRLCPKGVMTVYCEFHLDEFHLDEAHSESLTRPGDDNATFTQSLLDMFLKQQLCDVTIVVGDRKFPAHRSILAARSTFFASTFKDDTCENKTRVIHIDDCNPVAFHDFLVYLYSGSVDSISPKNASALYCIANKHGLSQLTSWCEQCLPSNLSVELFCDVLILAMKYDKPTLIKAIQDFFASHVEEILITEKWQNFIKENSIAANELFIKCTQTFKRKRIW